MERLRQAGAFVCQSPNAVPGGQGNPRQCQTCGMLIHKPKESEEIVAERIQLTGVRGADGSVIVPVKWNDGWISFDQEGISYWDGPEDLVKYINCPDIPEDERACYKLLVEIMRESDDQSHSSSEISES